MTADEIEADYLRDRTEFQAWMPKTPALIAEQAIIQDMLRRHAGAQHFGEHAYIARGAKVFTSHFSIGNNSWVAAGAMLRGHVVIGNQSTVNPYAHIAGRVIIGNGVRIAGLASIYGFNHGHQRIDVPIYRQPTTIVGITIGDGCWIGANAVIVDGVDIGAHSIIGGGAVVTRDVPDYSVVSGNPARLVRNRRDAGETVAHA